MESESIKKIELSFDEFKENVVNNINFKWNKFYITIEGSCFSDNRSFDINP